MIIHITGSSRNLGDDLPYIQKMAEIIQSRGATLARNWIDAARIRVARGIQPELADWTDIVKQDTDAIKRADCVIIECTNYSFTQGYQTAEALRLNKPVLLLTRKKHTCHYISGVEHENMRIRQYNDVDDLESCIAPILDPLHYPLKNCKI